MFGLSVFGLSFLLVVTLGLRFQALFQYVIAIPHEFFCYICNSDLYVW
jgi:hypothetical protein